MVRFIQRCSHLMGHPPSVIPTQISVTTMYKSVWQLAIIHCTAEVRISHSTSYIFCPSFRWPSQESDSSLTSQVTFTPFPATPGSSPQWVGMGRLAYRKLSCLREPFSLAVNLSRGTKAGATLITSCSPTSLSSLQPDIFVVKLHWAHSCVWWFYRLFLRYSSDNLLF